MFPYGIFDLSLLSKTVLFFELLKTTTLQKGSVCVCVNQNPGKQGSDIQSSTAELITGLMHLVPQTNMGDISPEAMEVSCPSTPPFTPSSCPPLPLIYPILLPSSTPHLPLLYPSSCPPLPILLPSSTHPPALLS